jgi:hypothetical protein
VDQPEHQGHEGHDRDDNEKITHAVIVRAGPVTAW